MNNQKLYPCPCCGYLTLIQKPPETYLICPICFWEDDGDYFGKYSSGNSNQVSLYQAQKNFTKFGACEEEWLNDVRSPTIEDKRSPDWQYIDILIANLIEKITIVFDGVQREDGVSLHETYVIDSYGNEEERAKARAIDNESRWQDVSDEWLESFPDAFPFYDPKGYRYYLPAYLILFLKNFINYKSLTLEFMMYSLQLSSDKSYNHYYLSRFKLLNQEQSKTICQFLRLIVKYGNEYDNKNAEKALKNYWYKFCDD